MDAYDRESAMAAELESIPTAALRAELQRRRHDQAARGEAQQPLPYSLSTGIAATDEIAGCLQSLREQGFCVLDRVIPTAELAVVRASVLASRPLIRAEHLRASAEFFDAQRIPHTGGERQSTDPTVALRSHTS